MKCVIVSFLKRLSFPKYASSRVANAQARLCSCCATPNWNLLYFERDGSDRRRALHEKSGTQECGIVSSTPYLRETEGRLTLFPLLRLDAMALKGDRMVLNHFVLEIRARRVDKY